MRQRLGIAAALLGDPSVMLFDEPVNGLDPEGIQWIRGLLKALAAEGRTVFVSSHPMSEMALTAKHLVVIGRGRLVADTPISEFVQQSSGGDVVVRSPPAPHSPSCCTAAARPSPPTPTAPRPPAVLPPMPAAWPGTQQRGPHDNPHPAAAPPPSTPARA